MPPVHNSCWVASVNEREMVGAVTPCRQNPATVELRQCWRHAPFGRCVGGKVKVGGGGYASGKTALPRLMGLSSSEAVGD